MQKEWGIAACQTRFHKDGFWYMPLAQFPGALADAYGYVLFQSRSDYIACPQLRIGERLNVSRGISRLPGYVRVEPQRRMRGAARAT